MGRLALLLILTSACSISQQVGQRYGNQAGALAERATDMVITWGPSLGGNGRVFEDGFDASVSAGLFASGVVKAAEPVRRTARRYGAALPSIAQSDFVAHAGVSGGYIFRQKTGFVDLHLGAGYWLLSGGLVVMGTFNQDNAALALGPELTFHLRLGSDVIEHELQFYLRGDFFVAAPADTGPQGVLGLRFVFDVQG